jgi:hypothetical protein
MAMTQMIGIGTAADEVRHHGLVSQGWPLSSSALAVRAACASAFNHEI